MIRVFFYFYIESVAMCNKKIAPKNKNRKAGITVTELSLIV